MARRCSEVKAFSPPLGLACSNRRLTCAVHLRALEHWGKLLLRVPFLLRGKQQRLLLRGQP